jgi:hypothetical protein
MPGDVQATMMFLAFPVSLFTSADHYTWSIAVFRGEGHGESGDDLESRAGRSCVLIYRQLRNQRIMAEPDA